MNDKDNCGFLWQIDWCTSATRLPLCSRALRQARTSGLLKQQRLVRLFHVSNLCEHKTKAVFDLKLMVGWGEHAVVLDESGIRVYCLHVNWGLNFVSLWAIRPGAATGLRFSTR